MDTAPRQIIITRGENTNAGKRVAEAPTLTGFLGSSTSLMLRFSSGMIPRGSLS